MSKQELRGKIDAIDNEILRLLSERAELTSQTIKFKKTHYDPVREQQIFARLEEMNKGPLKHKHIATIFREILSACREIQCPTTVAFLGPRATFSHSAVVQKFGTSILEHACPDIATVFDEVEKGLAIYGVVPFENSTEGVINYTLDRFTTTTMLICGEIYCDVELNLISKESSLHDIKKIFTHAKVLEQCAGWLQENAKGMDIVQMDSTALAAKQAARTKGGAAIASKLAAELYGLQILEQRVEDYKDNKTRFLLIGKEKMPKTGNDKTSVVFSVRHEPGTLYRALKSFEKYGLNLTMMQARPSRKSSWEYVFYVDLIGHEDDPDVKAAMKEMRKETIILKIMGSYPMALR
ncbi:MAG TPA: prephenate dehydratase [bacterium]|nr:prephenate dehydratase [bacterium]